MWSSTDLLYEYLLHVDVLVPQELLRGRRVVEVLHLAHPLQEVVEELLTDLDVLSVFVALP